MHPFAYFDDPPFAVLSQRLNDSTTLRRSTASIDMAQDNPITKESYYHGLLPREDMKSMLKSTGDFLVRISEPKAGQNRAFIISVMVYEKKEEAGIKHFVVQKNESNKYYVDNRQSFDSIAAIIKNHLAKRDSITANNADVILKKPVPRQPWELSHADITITKKLGEGAFGEVSLGKLNRPDGRQVPVAIKQAKLEALTKDQIKEIMLEARLHRSFKHPNIIQMYGVAAGQEPLMLVMELADAGALDSLLQKKEHPPEKKTEMCMQAAWGIDYLHTRKILHRDIAARNCLYGDGKVKIADFGLAREGTEFQMDPHNRVPIRWLAPETLRNAKYSQKTDVWAFGIMCWEIFSNGTEPYPGMTVAEVNYRIKQEQYRMPLPEIAPAFMHTLLMAYCWSESAEDRWGMSEIVSFMEKSTGLMQDAGAGSQGRRRHTSKKPRSEKTENYFA